MAKGILVKGSPKTGLISGTIAFFAGFASVALFGVTVHTLAKLLSLSIIEIGWLVAIPSLTGSILRIPFAALVDRYGGKLIITIQMLIALLGMIGIIVILSNKVFLNYSTLLLFGALAGVGISVFSSGITYVSYWYPQSKQGWALGAYAGFGNSAPGIFTALLPYALISLGLLYSYVAWAVFLAVAILIFIIIGKDAYYFQLKKNYENEEAMRISQNLGEELFPTNSVSRTLSKASRNWRVWALTIMYFTSFGGFMALTSWLPTYWEKLFGLSVAFAGLLAGIIFSLLSAIIRVLGGFLSDKLTGERVAIIGFSILILGSLLMILSSLVQQSIIGEIIIALGMGIANAAVFKMVPKYSKEAVGGASGIVGGLGAFGGFTLPPILAYFVQVYGKLGYNIGFSVFILLSILSIILLYSVIKKTF
ncbi:MAG: MFS transporter [Saccharolobus sp.]